MCMDMQVLWRPKCLALRLAAAQETAVSSHMLPCVCVSPRAAAAGKWFVRKGQRIEINNVGLGRREDQVGPKPCAHVVFPAGMFLFPARNDLRNMAQWAALSLSGLSSPKGTRCRDGTEHTDGCGTRNRAM